jgi:hypothetical protein
MPKRFLILFFLASACLVTDSAVAQTKKRSPQNAHAKQQDSVIRQTIVIDAKTMKKDTVYVRDLPRYRPEDGPYFPSDTERIIILRSEKKSVEQALQQMAGIRDEAKGKDEQGAIQYYNLPYRNPRLNLQIKLMHTNVRDIKDLKFYLTVTNSTSSPQKFLFDRPRQPGFVLWGASCRINNPMHAVLRHETRARYEVRAADREAMDRHMVSLKPSEWMMKQFSVADIAVVNEAVCKNGKLPPGTYTLQFILQGNYSNVVTFTVGK